jgi:hypothetical protein
VIAHPSLLLAPRDLAERMERVLERAWGAHLHICPDLIDAGPDDLDVDRVFDARGRTAAASPAAGQRRMVTALFDGGMGNPRRFRIHSAAGAWVICIPGPGQTALVQVMLPADGTPARRNGAATDLLAADLDASLACALARVPWHAAVGRQLTPVVVLDAAPRLEPAPLRERWSAAGEVALAFDPICGDGVGQAARSSLLAAAAADAAQRGAPVPDLALHVRHRLTSAFRYHLATCLRFYSSATAPEHWAAERAATAAALDEADRLLEGTLRPRYTMVDGRLRPPGFSPVGASSRGARVAP